MEEVILIQNLTKYYGKNRGIENLSLQVIKGEFFGFIGPNGAGKSTTIRTMLGLLKPDSGTIKIFGKSIQKEKTEILKQIGYLPSEPAFYSGMKVKDVLSFAAEFYETDCREEAGRLCESLKLDVSKRVEELSLGNRKKVSIVCALQHDALLYILDEPTSGLDPLMQKEFFELLKEKNRAGASIFLSSHILGEIQKYCTRAAIIRDGALVLADKVANICRSSVKRVTLHGVTEVPGIAMTAVQKSGDGVSFLYNGNVRDLISSLQGLALTDVTIAEPALEETFLHFYDESPVSVNSQGTH